MLKFFFCSKRKININREEIEIKKKNAHTPRIENLIDAQNTINRWWLWHTSQFRFLSFFWFRFLRDFVFIFDSIHNISQSLPYPNDLMSSRSHSHVAIFCFFFVLSAVFSWIFFYIKLSMRSLAVFYFFLISSLTSLLTKVKNVCCWSFIAFVALD